MTDDVNLVAQLIMAAGNVAQVANAWFSKNN